jgi:hypothetical protein
MLMPLYSRGMPNAELRYLQIRDIDRHPRHRRLGPMLPNGAPAWHNLARIPGQARINRHEWL